MKHKKDEGYRQRELARSTGARPRAVRERVQIRIAEAHERIEGAVLPSSDELVRVCLLYHAFDLSAVREGLPMRGRARDGFPPTHSEPLYSDSR